MVIERGGQTITAQVQAGQARRHHDAWCSRPRSCYAGAMTRSLRSRRPDAGGAAAAGRPAAAAEPRRGGGPGPPAGPGRPDPAHGRGAPAGLDDPLGPARHRQDHHRAPAGQGGRLRVPAAVGGVLRRRRPEEGVRDRARPPRRRPGDAAVRRRDPPLQPRPAGRLPALRRGGDRHPGRRHHREPVVRAQRRAAVALPGLRAEAAGRRGAGEPAGQGRGVRGPRAAADARGARRR